MDYTFSIVHGNGYGRRIHKFYFTSFDGLCNINNTNKIADACGSCLEPA